MVKLEADSYDAPPVNAYLLLCSQQITNLLSEEILSKSHTEERKTLSVKLFITLIPLAGPSVRSRPLHNL